MSRNGEARARSTAPFGSGDLTGRVVAVETGVAVVTLTSGRSRASFGAALLADIARDPARAPRVGDRVRLRSWCDGYLTVEGVVARAL